MATKKIKRSYRTTQDLSGKTFGRLTAIERVYIPFASHAMWKCKCDCGTEKVIAGSSLRRGNIRSCGCFNQECRRERMTTHGMTKSPEHKIWDAMRQRCDTESNIHYHNYGGRGIKVCERWSRFENFFADMGERPGKHYSIDRINNDGNYEPENCRWTVRIVQARNTRANKLVTFNGETKCIAEWAELFGMPYKLLWKRLKLGWSIEVALKTPKLARSEWGNGRIRDRS
jgi:hypothetical protein